MGHAFILAGISTSVPTGMVTCSVRLHERVVWCSHCFQKGRGKLWTHLSEGTLTKGQIDYILVRKKWRNSVKNTEPYNFFNSLRSDHRVKNY